MISKKVYVWPKLTSGVDAAKEGLLSESADVTLFDGGFSPLFDLIAIQNAASSLAGAFGLVFGVQIGENEYLPVADLVLFRDVVDPEGFKFKDVEKLIAFYVKTTDLFGGSGKAFQILMALHQCEYGDARSYLDEYFYNSIGEEKASKMIEVLQRVSGIAWYYDDSDGWGYDEGMIITIS
ncbi:hypothetical protein [Photobacterium leiognathi]|uniref:hypothetical protein n=1 Tax=Photobacterium leiognathi TaxID=553611 RepID=UPI0029810CA8|nr:hypothetical protein [Photobacterium leiognathi]